MTALTRQNLEGEFLETPAASAFLWLARLDGLRFDLRRLLRRAGLPDPGWLRRGSLAEALGLDYYKESHK